MSFVNSDEYGPNALADAFVEIEKGSGSGSRPVVAARGSGARRGIRLFATPPLAAGGEGPASQPSRATVMPAAAAAAITTALSSSHPTASGNGGGERFLLSGAAPFLSAERRASSSGAVVTTAAGALAVRDRQGGGSSQGHGEDAVASLRRLIGLWLFFHEMVRSSSLAKVGTFFWFGSLAERSRRRPIASSSLFPLSLCLLRNAYRCCCSPVKPSRLCQVRCP